MSIIIDLKVLHVRGNRSICFYHNIYHVECTRGYSWICASPFGLQITTVLYLRHFSLNQIKVSIDYKTCPTLPWTV